MAEISRITLEQIDSSKKLPPDWNKHITGISAIQSYLLELEETYIREEEEQEQKEEEEERGRDVDVDDGHNNSIRSSRKRELLLSTNQEDVIRLGLWYENTNQLERALQLYSKYNMEEQKKRLKDVMKLFGL